MSEKNDKKRKLISAAIASRKAGEGDVQQLQKENEAAFGSAMLADTMVLGGVRMRPFTLSTVALLKQINSPLILGVPVESIPNVVTEVMKLFVLQSSTLDEAVELVRDVKALELAAYKMADGIPIRDTQKIVSDALSAFETAVKAQVIPVAPKGGPSAPSEAGND